MPPLHPTQAIFVEERYLASIFYARLRSICAAKAAIAHVDVAQTFQTYVAHFHAGHAQAQADVETVLRLLNDDGRGLGVWHNTAVGYRFAQAARLFHAMAHLPADRLKVPATAPVARAARFTEVFVEAQLQLEERPPRTGNAVLDMIRNLSHRRLVIAGIKTFVDHALEANAEIIYGPATKVQYDRLRAELVDVWMDALAKLGRAARIIQRYADPTNAHAPQGLRAEVPAITPLVLAVDEAKTRQRVVLRTREGHAERKAVRSPTSGVNASQASAEIVAQDEYMREILG